jgi:hypothetical protein
MAGGREPSPFYESRFQPTDAEKLDRYNRLLVNAGRYQAADGRLTSITTSGRAAARCRDDGVPAHGERDPVVAG